MLVLSRFSSGFQTLFSHLAAMRGGLLLNYKIVLKLNFNNLKAVWAVFSWNGLAVCFLQSQILDKPPLLKAFCKNTKVKMYLFSSALLRSYKKSTPTPSNMRNVFNGRPLVVPLDKHPGLKSCLTQHPRFHFEELKFSQGSIPPAYNLQLYKLNDFPK